MICVTGLALGMQAAHAQEAASEPIQKVQITGSRISSPNADSPSPLQILSSADIAASGAVNLQELMQKNPTMGTPTLSRTNSNFLTSGGGVSTVNLRNLGDARRPEHHPDRFHRTGRAADRRRLGDLRFGRGRRCRQHHPQA
jgi:hypothetical protein